VINEPGRDVLAVSLAALFQACWGFVSSSTGLVNEEDVLAGCSGRMAGAYAGRGLAGAIGREGAQRPAGLSRGEQGCRCAAGGPSGELVENRRAGQADKRGQGTGQGAMHHLASWLCRPSAASSRTSSHPPTRARRILAKQTLRSRLLFQIYPRACIHRSYAALRRALLLLLLLLLGVPLAVRLQPRQAIASAAVLETQGAVQRDPIAALLVSVLCPRGRASSIP